VPVGSTGEQEHADSHRDEGSSQVLPVLVTLARHQFAHHHHWDHFGGLGQHLGGEADVFECLILAPAAEDVGEGGKGVFVHRSPVARLLGQGAVQTSHREGQDAIHEHEELGVLELLTRVRFGGTVRSCHHTLLEDAPCEVGGLRSRRSTGRVRTHNGRCKQPLACPSVASSSARQCLPETLGDGATHLREPTVLCGYNQEHPVPDKTCSVYSLSKGREARKANILPYSERLRFKLPVEPDRQDQGTIVTDAQLPFWCQLPAARPSSFPSGLCIGFHFQLPRPGSSIQINSRFKPSRRNCPPGMISVLAVTSATSRATVPSPSQK